MTHEAAWDRLPDLLFDRDDHGLLAHVANCHLCQARLFRLARVDRVLRGSRKPSHQGRARLQLVTLAAASVAAVAAAVGVFVVAGHRPVSQPAVLALHTLSGKVVAHALITPVDGANQSIALVAHHLTTGNTSMYSLWTRAPGGGRRAVLVGQFMVSHDGECRARFNLAGLRHSAQFWITRATAPTAVIAAT